MNQHVQSLGKIAVDAVKDLVKASDLALDAQRDRTHEAVDAIYRAKRDDHGDKTVMRGGPSLEELEEAYKNEMS